MKKDTSKQESPKDLSVLSDEENVAYAEKADELARKHSVSKVYPVVMIDPETFTRTVAYLKEPSYVVKLRIMDKGVTLGPYSAADELREAIILREDSDAITYGEGDESDTFKMGITDFCIGLLRRMQNQFKKK